MEILEAEKGRILSFFSEKTETTEVEARLTLPLDFYTFNRLLKHFTFSKKNGGFELSGNLSNYLNITGDFKTGIRETIQGVDAIKVFWMSNDIEMIKKLTDGSFSAIKKAKTNFLNLSNYPIKISVNKEDPLESFDLLKDIEYPKEYRLITRNSLKMEYFCIDFSVVKFGSGRSFQKSDVLNALPCYEIEIELMKDGDKEKIYEEFILILLRIFVILGESSRVLTIKQEKDILDLYLLLISKDETLKKSNRKNTSYSFITAKPITLHLENVNTISRNYGITYKADGENRLLIVEKDQLFLIDCNFKILATGITLKGWNSTLLEGEYIKETRTIYLYDILFVKKLDIRNKPLESYNPQNTSRLMYLKDFMNSVEDGDIKIREKKYSFANDDAFFEKVSELWENRKGLPYKVDGLIFAPSLEPYKNSKLFKWKPPELNTIDFLIEFTENKENIKVANLYSTGSIDQLNRKTAKLRRKPCPKLFQTIEIPLDETGRIMIQENGMTMELINDVIAEFSYRKEEEYPWVPIRIRTDKTIRYRRDNNYFGNSLHVANDIWKSIQNPVTIDILKTGKIVKYTAGNKIPRLPYQKFHTLNVKKQLLEKVVQGGYLIDFGSCRGGDFNRWEEMKLDRVVGIERDPESIEEAKKRKRNTVDVEYICGDLGKLIFPDYVADCDKGMKEAIPQKYMFDTVSSQFVIHYFFENEKTLRTYLQNVTDCLKIGGYFVGTTFDGCKVYNALKRKNEIQGKDIWKITKLYAKRKFVDGKPNYGMGINVLIKSIGLEHKEYLVSFPFLEKMAKEYGLELQELIPFEDFKNDFELSQEEKMFSYMFSAFIFKKTKHAPDSLYKKLLKKK